MSNVVNIVRVEFSVGQLVHHRLFGYRGVIIDVDQRFEGSESWYQTMARSQPPKNKPWYHVLVHDSDHRTYVAERNLEPDPSAEPIKHPQVGDYFGDFYDGRYHRINAHN